MKEVIRCEDIWKIYNSGTPAEVQALRGVDLKIKAGELTAIMGSSGCGKSTLLHIIGCLDTPTKGNFFLDGQDISKLSSNQLALIRRKSVGFVFQFFNLIPSLTALQNVELPMVFSGISMEKRKEHAKKLLESVDLADRLNFTPSKLSGGEHQRVAIARSLANNPSLVLADEPTGNLDSKSGKEIMEIFKKLNKDNHTIIVVTHDPEIAKYAKRKIKMMDGKIVSGE